MKAITLLFILFLAVSLGGSLTSISVLSSQPALADQHESEQEAEQAEPGPDEPDANPDAPDAELPGGDMPDEAAGDEEPADEGY
jgi:hypothetical protein